jgi:hypothetical protein
VSKALCANIDPHRPNLTIDTEFEAVSIPLDRPVPIGLILNEVVTVLLMGDASLVGRIVSGISASAGLL